jgi:bifunctional DNA-binding transcriptional regulator/antitoxin component of YhaV-PrlF toxin-antitoxin module
MDPPPSRKYIKIQRGREIEVLNGSDKRRISLPPTETGAGVVLSISTFRPGQRGKSGSGLDQVQSRSISKQELQRELNLS